AANRSPADELDQAVGWIRMGRDQHSAAGVFAVVEGEEQAGLFVPVFVVVATQRKGAAAQLRYSKKNAEQVAEMTERLEITVGQGGDVGGEPDREKIQRIDFAVRVGEANQIDGAFVTGKQRLERSFCAIAGEIAQKGIAGA